MQALQGKSCPTSTSNLCRGIFLLALKHKALFCQDNVSTFIVHSLESVLGLLEWKYFNIY